ncbi:hypothetical protein BN7_4027 [Wickerhamomyces ciferrii]|uniref:ATP synthase mitochondrial F1 complex assembly factor 1 n=1 Tax=Wickerhamomyces ciferrii (strain ATCC 14091 / BCRC 22168 / CBS 111 / JCM 3599 / NBRC 0793 / NRRL Y-1031 F-60-10) TaxID=1206466 RepID=K0KT13_WICCF|nr:uncharacterized protein BN7_4027 [Wickerhamomyces ciferrii]CCH44463.1 hypothetical protein BN7_4027 [Wickerhamomyces ciferrii]
MKDQGYIPGLGASNVDELKEKLKDELEKTRKELNKIDPLKELEEYERKQAIEAQEKKAHENKLRKGRDPTAPEKPYKTLSSFVDVEKISELPLKELEYIWRARFAKHDNALISLVPGEVFDKLYKNARENPTFVLPLPREGEGFDLHYIQWQFVGPNTVHCMFTTLMEFKVHKEFARPHTSIIFHTELKDDKDVVLMNGTVEKDAAVKLPESQLLLLNVQRFYGVLAETEASKRRLQLLKDFTSGSSNFTVEALLAEAQSLEN